MSKTTICSFPPCVELTIPCDWTTVCTPTRYVYDLFALQGCDQFRTVVGAVGKKAAKFRHTTTNTQWEKKHIISTVTYGDTYQIWTQPEITSTKNGNSTKSSHITRNKYSVYSKQLFDTLGLHGQVFLHHHCPMNKHLQQRTRRQNVCPQDDKQA